MAPRLLVGATNCKPCLIAGRPYNELQLPAEASIATIASTEQQPCNTADNTRGGQERAPQGHRATGVRATRNNEAHPLNAGCPEPSH